MTTLKNLLVSTTARRFAQSALSLACLAALPAGAVTTFGSLGNFDVINDTGGDCNGFEIELEGIKSTDISYAFDYETYGKPRIIDSTNVSGNPVVRVRYESPYNPNTQLFTLKTVTVPNATMQTQGHQCVNTPLVNNSTGCEHFGLGIIGNPTKTTYHWLVPDAIKQGNLTYAGSPVTIPAPVWNIQPPANPLVNPNPIVQVVIPKEAPEVEQQNQCSLWGAEAQWVVSYVTETEHAELDNLVINCGNRPNTECQVEVPHEQAETEVEWQLQQARPTCDENGIPIAGAEDENEVHGVDKQPVGANKAVIRRYEFYAYTGAYDPDNNEAQPLGGCHDSPYACDANNNIDLNQHNADLGPFRGAQNAAINIDDADGDGKDNLNDNCALRVNNKIPNVADQRDTDGDGYGNICDPDLDNNHIVDNNDINLMKLQFLKKNPAANADLNGDGKVNFADLAVLKTFLNKAPGPNGIELLNAP